MNLTRSAALEFGKAQIRINCICPGGINTPILHRNQPGGREALYAGKVLAIGVVIAIVALAAGVVAALLLDLVVALPWHLLLVVVLGVVSLPPVVVLTNILALRVRARVALVPILTFPILVPQLLAATEGAASALAGDGAMSLGWSGLLAAFALVYGVLGLTIVPAAIE